MKKKGILNLILILALYGEVAFCNEPSGRKGSAQWGDVSSSYVQVENLLWQDMPENLEVGKLWQEAKKYCEALTIESGNENISGFRLASIEELEKLYSYKESLKYVTDARYYSSSSWSFFSNGGVYILDFSNGKKDDIKSWDRESFYYRCVKDVEQVNPESFNSLAEKIYKSKLNELLTFDEPIKPKLKDHVNENSLKKGEFETTSEFEARRQKESERVDYKNRKIKKENEDLLLGWKSEIERLRALHEEKIGAIDRDALYLKSFEEALYQVYGNSRIHSADYEADREVFKIRAVSTMAKPISILNLISDLNNVLVQQKSSSDGYVTLVAVYNVGNESILEIKTNKRIAKLDTKAFNAKYAVFKGKKYDAEGYREFNFKPNDKVYIVVDRITDSSYSTPDKFCCYPGNAAITDIELDLSKTVPEYDRLEFLLDETFEIPVIRSKAREFKKLITAQNFQPVMKLEVDRDSFKIIGIDNLTKIDSLKKERDDFHSSFNSLSKLKKFIRKYPGSSFIEKASHRVSVLEDEQRRQAAAEIARIEKNKLEKRKRAEQQRSEAKFLALGRCQVGSSVVHREKWNTTTSSGNIVADALFSAATKEEFIIEFEGVVEGFVGEKVRVIINDYRVRQTIGGGLLQPKTYRKYEIGEYADKYLGKTQFYPRSRCG